MRRLDDRYFRVTKARDTGHLDVGDGHRIYWEEAGNPDGVPLILIHGGPGGSSSKVFRVFIDPDRFRIIQFDQRGCGRSEPLGELASNSLQHTLTDMENLRYHLGVKKWVVAGGSWGSTVALAYGETYPNNCLGLLLVSMWLCRKKDIEWWYQGVRKIFPELWDQFASLVPKIERDDLRKAYSTRILYGEDKLLAKQLAKQLYFYEEGFMRFEVPLAPPLEDNAISYGRIFSHYANNSFFLLHDQLLKQAYRVKDLPAVVVTGRYDMCTTPDNAYDLCSGLDNAELVIVPAAGHNPMEVAMSRACLEAIERLVQKIGSGQ